jgi:hypothetical protein
MDSEKGWLRLAAEKFCLEDAERAEKFCRRNAIKCIFFWKGLRNVAFYCIKALKIAVAR